MWWINFKGATLTTINNITCFFFIFMDSSLVQVSVKFYFNKFKGGLG